MRPVDVTKENEGIVWQTLYSSGARKPNDNLKFNLGDSQNFKSKLHFGKGYLPNWSKRTFIILERKPKHIPVYKL